jgi:hypothetical protein
VLAGGVLVGLVVLAVVLVLRGGGDEDTTSGTLPSAVPSTVPATPSTAPAAFATPEDAIADYLSGQGLDYLGDCSSGSADTDLGRWCSKIYEDNGPQRVYLVGEYGTGGGFGLRLDRTENGWFVTSETDIPNVEGV